MKKSYCPEQGVEFGLDHPVEFEADQISLDIPKEGITDLKGWELIPSYAPVVSIYVCCIPLL